MKRIRLTAGGEELVVGRDIDGCNAAKLLMRKQAVEVPAQRSAAASVEEPAKPAKRTRKKAG